MSVLDFCDQHPAAVSLDATVAQAIEAMIAHSVGAVAILDGNKVVGIFTERDVLKKQSLSGRDPARTPVRELMTTPVETITTRTRPGEAFALMMGHHFRHLAIVDGAGKLLGMLSIRNLLQAQVRELQRQLNSMEQYFTNDAAGG
jgi:CBS domain-containing protein